MELFSIRIRRTFQLVSTNSIRTTIIITIRDPKHKGVVYNEGIRLLNIHNFEHSNIIIRNDIHLSEGV